MLLLELIFFPIYFMVLLLMAIIVAFNGKRIKARYGFDALPFYMGIYLLNVFVVLAFMKEGVFLLITTTVILLAAIVRTSKIQVISVTGAPGVGKSATALILSENTHLNEIYLEHLIMKSFQKSNSLHESLVKEFGNDIVDKDKKTLNKRFLHEEILPRDVARRKLAHMLEFPVIKVLLKELYSLTKERQDFIVLDAPLLFDFKFLPYLCYPNLAVFVTEPALPVKRVAERDHLTISEAAKQVNTSKAQVGDILRKADIKINNDGNLVELKHKLLHELGPFLL